MMTTISQPSDWLKFKDLVIFSAGEVYGNRNEYFDGRRILRAIWPYPGDKTYILLLETIPHVTHVYRGT